MATDLCLPLLKYSFAVGAREDKTIPWNHIQADDIYVVVSGNKDAHNPDEKLDLRVVQGVRVLDSIDISQLIDQAIQTRRSLEEHGIAPHIEQLPIFGMTKDALLALRYTPADKRTRRLQLRLENPSHAQCVVNSLKARGMEFQNQRPNTARQNTANRAVTATDRERLLTATSSNSSPHFQSGGYRTDSLHGAPVRMNDIGTLPRLPTARTAQESSTAIPAYEYAHATQSHDIGSLPRLLVAKPQQPSSYANISNEHTPAVHSQEMPPPPFLSRDELAAPREVVPTRPSTSQIYRSSTTPHHPSFYDTQEAPSRRPSDPTGERPSSTSHIANLTTIRGAVEAEATPPRMATMEMPPTSLLPALSTGLFSSGTPEPGALTSQLSDGGRPQTGRPSTSATSIPMNYDDSELPPRRELPFKRPDSARSSRPGTSAMSLPPLPKPKLRQEGSGSGSPLRADSHSPEKGIVISRPGTASPLKRAYNSAEGEVERAQTSMGLGSKAIITTTGDTLESPAKKARIAETAVSNTTVPRNPSAMDALLASRRPLADRSPNNTSRVRRTDSLADAPHEIESPPHKSHNATDAYERTSNALQRSAIANRDLSAAELGAVGLGEHAMQSREDRESVLEQFMMERLEDPAFATLCEDVEGCWRGRILLGL
ncbi:hypothetical protein LTR56_008959 [Elasticomyces elasticus]|nr:hypothetical protein LTR56_008959 [Elasticomyces elasticus]KAK3663189.1 hypothetical protein LTR22_006098 [Elasticomyces elasticus]KAK4924086.1 hypothetical protein LTR49_008826 [Elasticomyces elasticus]KAK5764444.1 hypothetical protein LTS12_005420 [Elasticomyces elasticus]